MKSVILDAAGDGETPPLRWRAFHYTTEIVERAFGIMVSIAPEWGLYVYLGKWLIGIERTREEDD